MKKVIFILAIGTLLTSCGGGCDTSTVEGAADCWCSLIDEMVVAEADGDATAQADIEGRRDKAKDEIETHLDAGDYTENALEEILKDRNCR
ncbi:hypothetical protein JYT74_03090 [Crocinitomix catalasitica]|nr:hypothetical protein [Crocinitomix catalasitica]